MTRPPANYYILLRLPPPPSPLTPQLIKKAYHAALLLHHPDKSVSAPTPQAPSVDLLTLAYTTLSSPELRTEYNLTLASAPTVGGNGSEVVQTVDLDEFLHDEETGRWVKACRCGEGEGFVLSEEELEKVVEEGEREIVVGCGGCSLWWRVEFAVVDE